MKKNTGLSKIAQIAINVSDLDRATGFYRDRLGMQLLMQTGGMSFFDCDGVLLMLSMPSSPEFEHPSSIIYFQVEDIVAHHRDLQAREVEFIQAPHFVARLGNHDLWLAFFRDSEANVMALRSLVPGGQSPG